MSSDNHDELDAPVGEALADLSRLVLTDQPLADVLAHVTFLAKRAIPAAAEVSVTLMDRSRTASVAATGDMAVRLDERQNEVGSGPCLEAANTGAEMHIHDMVTETRWPAYTRTAVEAGALSSLSVPLPMHETTVGALNIYSRARNGFDDRMAEAARKFAAAAAVALHNAQAISETQTLAEQMRQAMATRAVIEQAKGILMGQRRIDADDAFEILRKLSQESNRKLHDVAQAVIEMAGRGDPREH